MNQTADHKTVGVLGGMGPEATLDFFAKLLAATGANSDQEHLHVLIDNNPKVPNRNEAVAGRGPSPGPALAEMARDLERAGADFLVMACNAAHAFEADIRAATPLPFVSLIEEAAQATLARRPGLERAGVLAAAGTLDAGLYERAFAARGVRASSPAGEARERFMALLYRIKAGDKGEEVRAAMRSLAGELLDAGAQVIVAGCTEVPLVLTQRDLPCPLVDATAVLAERTVMYAKGVLPLPGRTIETS